MKKNILVIGAAGNVCLEVIKVLADKNVNLRVAARSPEKAKAMDLPKCEIKSFDYLRPETFSSICEGIENMLLVSPPAHLNLHEIVGKLIEQAKLAGVKNIVNISNMGIHDEKDPMRIIETHIENWGINYTFLRPNCHMQYFNTFFRKSILEDDLIQAPAGQAKTSFVDLRDVGEVGAHLLMQDKLKNRTYQLTGGEAFNLGNVTAILSEELGRDISYHEINEEDYRLLLKSEGWMDVSINASISVCRFVKQGLNSMVTSGINDILGRDPKTFREYVKDYIKYWQIAVEKVS